MNNISIMSVTPDVGGMLFSRWLANDVEVELYQLIMEYYDNKVTIAIKADEDSNKDLANILRELANKMDSVNNQTQIQNK